MNKHIFAGIVLGSLVVVCAQTATPAATRESLVTGASASATAAVVNVAAQDGTVSGVLVNKSDRTLRDIQLLIRHTWMWNNERHPGASSPGRAEFYTLAGPVPPGASVPFTEHDVSPLPQRSDGHFTTSIDVVSFMQVGE